MFFRFIRPRLCLTALEGLLVLGLANILWSGLSSPIPLVKAKDNITKASVAYPEVSKDVLRSQEIRAPGYYPAANLKFSSTNTTQEKPLLRALESVTINLHPRWSGNYSASSGVWGDMDGDGDLDLAIGGSSCIILGDITVCPSQMIYRNEGNWQFTPLNLGEQSAAHNATAHRHGS